MLMWLSAVGTAVGVGLAAQPAPAKKRKKLYSDGPQATLRDNRRRNARQPNAHPAVVGALYDASDGEEVDVDV